MRSWTTSMPTTWGSFLCIQTLIEGIITADRTREFLTGVYDCNCNYGETTALNNFNLVLLCVGHHPNLIPGEVNQEVSIFNNQNHITTSTTQSLIFPPDTVSDHIMLHTDHHHHQNITPASLHACIRVVINAVNESDYNVVFRVAVSIPHMNITTINGVDLPPSKPSPFIQWTICSASPANTNTTSSPHWTCITWNRNPRAKTQSYPGWQNPKKTFFPKSICAAIFQMHPVSTPSIPWTYSGCRGVN